MQFSLDRKRLSHKQNQCSASDSFGLIFTRMYRSSDYDSVASENQPKVKESRAGLVRVPVLEFASQHNLLRTTPCESIMQRAYCSRTIRDKNWSDAAKLNCDFNKLATFHISYENYVGKGTPRVGRR